MSRWCRYLLCAGGVALVLWLLPSRGRPSVKSLTAGGKEATSLHFVGTSSCSARACHGSLDPVIDKDTHILRDEYPKWLLRDRHARAYETLLKEKSQLIAKNLGGKQPAHERADCLACHAMPQFHEPAKLSELQLGVSCESCHGPASKWLEEHTQPTWRKLNPSDKVAKGMLFVTNNDKDSRAKACVGCHVGAPAAAPFLDRDVNHDLIAAGHPRLNFEFSSFLANLPAHWNEDHHAKKEDSLCAWATGQIESARAAVKLLEHRAGKKERWPEFAEYDCFACHHNLQAEDNWRQKPSAGGRKPGTLPWGTWYFAMPELLAKYGNADGNLSGLLAKLKAEMEKPLPSVPLPTENLDAQLVALGKRVAKLDRGKLVDLLARAESDHGWDVAEQLFLGACALPEKTPGMRKELAALDQHRALKPGRSSPEGFSPSKFFAGFKQALKAAQP